MSAEGTAAPQYSDLVQVLAGASVIARNFWDMDEFDIYDCMKRSWYVRGMPVALAAVQRASRKVVPGGDIYAFNCTPGRTAEQIAGLFAAATAAAIAAEKRDDLRRGARAVHRRRGPVNGAGTERRRLGGGLLIGESAGGVPPTITSPDGLPAINRACPACGGEFGLDNSAGLAAATRHGTVVLSRDDLQITTFAGVPVCESCKTAMIS